MLARLLLAGFFASFSLGACQKSGGPVTFATDKNPCQASIAAISARDFLTWQGLEPSCGYSKLDAAFPRLEDDWGEAYLGSELRAAKYRLHEAAGYPQGLRVWFEGDRVLLIDAEFPELARPGSELVARFGEPALKLDYQYDVVPAPRASFVYPERGVALFFVAPEAGDFTVTRIALFPPCTADEYVAQLKPVDRAEEQPFEP